MCPSVLRALVAGITLRLQRVPNWPKIETARVNSAFTNDVSGRFEVAKAAAWP